MVISPKVHVQAIGSRRANQCTHVKAEGQEELQSHVHQTINQGKMRLMSTLVIELEWWIELNRVNCYLYPNRIQYDHDVYCKSQS